MVTETNANLIFCVQHLVMVRLIEYRFDFDSIRLIKIEIEKVPALINRNRINLIFYNRTITNSVSHIICDRVILQILIQHFHREKSEIINNCTTVKSKPH